MKFSELLRHIQATIYAAFINYLIAVSLYFVVCGIPFEKTEMVIAAGLWFVYFGFVDIIYCLIVTLFSGIKKAYVSLVLFLIAAIVVCGFHFVVTGYIFQDIRMISSFIILLILSADIPFLSFYIQKKLK